MAYSLLLDAPAYTRVPSTLRAGDDCTTPPVENVHRKSPVDPFTARTALTLWPMYSVPSAPSAGDDSNNAVVDRCHTKVPVTASSAYSTLFTAAYTTPSHPIAGEEYAAGDAGTPAYDHNTTPVETVNAVMELLPPTKYPTPLLLIATEDVIVDVPPAGSDQRTATAGPTGPGNAPFPVCLAFRPTCPHTCDDGVGDADPDNDGVILLESDNDGVILLESEIVVELEPVSEIVREIDEVSEIVREIDEVSEIVREIDEVSEIVPEREAVTDIVPDADGDKDDDSVALSESDGGSAKPIANEPHVIVTRNHHRSLFIFTLCLIPLRSNNSKTKMSQGCAHQCTANGPKLGGQCGSLSAQGS
jgi:hypothetical protein